MCKLPYPRVKLTEEALAMLAVMRLLRMPSYTEAHGRMPFVHAFDQIRAQSMRVPALLAMRQPHEKI